jgi:hypothetical protein
MACYYSLTAVMEVETTLLLAGAEELVLSNLMGCQSTVQPIVMRGNFNQDPSLLQRDL